MEVVREKALVTNGMGGAAPRCCCDAVDSGCHDGIPIARTSLLGEDRAVGEGGALPGRDVVLPRGIVDRNTSTGRGGPGAHSSTATTRHASSLTGPRSAKACGWGWG